MSKESIYVDGVPCVLLTSETTFTLPSATNSEPIMVRNTSEGVCTVSTYGSETINGNSTVPLRSEVCILFHPDGSNWKYFSHNIPNVIGFSDGVGGSVTQTTSVTTAVTLNKITGKITMFAHDYSNNDIQSFQFNNSFIEEDDIIAVSIRSGSNKLNAQVDEVNNGSCNISVGDIHNQSTGSISVVLNFAVIKGTVT